MIKLLSRPIDNAILIYFRIFAGILMSQELINGLLIGKFQIYVAPEMHFNYLFFDWIKPWPYWGMVFHYTVTIVAGFCVAFNFRYRIFSVILFLGLGSLFLMEATEYINHNYLYCLISFWMMFLPLDKNRSEAPAWILYLLLFHMGLAYFFGGIAKLNSDWLSGTPMDIYLSQRKDYLLGFIYNHPWAAYAFSYGGLAFDLLIIPLLVFRSTRIYGLLCSIFFHLSNVLMFGLATFPWFSLLLTSMFFNPSWPRKIPFLKSFLPTQTDSKEVFQIKPILLGVISLYICLHIALPLRHHLYPGVTSWTEEGHMFAWRMMLRAKQGDLKLWIQNKKNGQILSVDYSHFITSRQYQDIVGHPDMILQFAHHLRDHYQKKLNSEVAVFGSARVALNGRKKVEMIRPGTNLAVEKRSIKPYSWVINNNQGVTSITSGR